MKFALLCRHRREVPVFELNQLAKTRFNTNKLHVGLHMSRIYNWWLSSNTYTVSQLRIQEMDKAPKAVILRGGDSREGSEIHPYSKFLDPSLLCPPRDQILAAPLTGTFRHQNRPKHAVFYKRLKILWRSTSAPRVPQRNVWIRHCRPLRWAFWLVRTNKVS